MHGNPVKKTSNVLFTLAETKQYCVKKLFKTVNITCQMSKLNQLHSHYKNSS